LHFTSRIGDEMLFFVQEESRRARQSTRLMLVHLASLPKRRVLLTRLAGLAFRV